MAPDTLAYAIGEVLAHIVAKITGRTFDLEAKKAKKIGEYFVLGLFAAVAVIITFVFS